MQYNEKNVEQMFRKYLTQAPVEYDYKGIPNEWFDIAIDWLHQNNIKSLTKDKVYIDTTYNLAPLPVFSGFTHEGLSMVCMNNDKQYFPFAIAWYTDLFETAEYTCIKKTSLMNKLLMRSDITKYEYCNNPLVVIFHELGHWVVYHHFCSKLIKKGHPLKDVEKYANQNIWKIFGKNKIIDETSIENSAEWFVMYALNPTFTKTENPLVYRFFSETVGVQPFINVSTTKIKEWSY